MPVGRFSIQFDEHATQLATKVSKLQKGIASQLDSWFPRSRYSIFRSIILPTMQYGLLLHFTHYKRHKSYSFEITLEKAYKFSSGWIASSQAQRSLLTANLLELMEFASYCNHLCIRLYHYLVLMANTNPLQ